MSSPSSSPPAATGITVPTDSTHKPLPRSPLPFPRRPSSPPLPPRKNAAGLPPTYIAHLRALLHQWLAQQTRLDGGLPGRGAERTPLWDHAHLEAIERAIWEGAVLRKIEGGGGGEGAGLLGQDWEAWALGSDKRKKAWKAELSAQEPEPLVSGTSTKTDKSKPTKRGSTSESDAPRGRAALSPLVSTTGTPTRGSRTPSIAPSETSTTKKGKGVAREVERPSQSGEEGSDGDLAEEKVQEWYGLISGLPGFERFSLPKRDEWEVIEDEMPKRNSISRILPGAFPQAGWDHDHDHDPSTLKAAPVVSTTTARARFMRTSSPTKSVHAALPDAPLLKPVFCLHYPPPAPRLGSSSTLRLRRQSSIGGDSSESHGSPRSWFGGTAGRSSEMTLRPENEPLEIRFVEGKFALPTPKPDRHHPRRRMRGGTPSRSTSTENANADSPTGADASEADESSEGEGDEASSSWSGTQRAGSRVRAAQARGESVIVSGREDDVPRQEVEKGRVALVGGTTIVRGIRDAEERRALERIFKALLYTIQSMYLELDLLDSFRIPREPDPLPVPPKSRQSFDLPHALTEDTGLAPRRASARDRERRERTRSFFHRLGKDTRGLFDGLLGRRHHPEEHPPPPIPPRSETLDIISIERPSTPMSISYQSITSDKSGLGITGAQTPPIQLPTEKHLAMLGRLENLLPSTTPGLKVPMPPLLLRVREEELVRREMAKEEMKEECTSTIDGLPVLRGPGEGTVRGTDSPSRGRALAYRLGGDVRSGLGALAPGPDTFAGWTRLQKLDVLYCVGVDDRPEPTKDLERDTSDGDGGETKLGTASEKSTFCQRPEQESHTFYDPSSDISLEDFFEGLSAEAGDMAACDRAGCDVVGGEHVRWWIHGGRKIEGKVQSLQSAVITEGAEQIGEAKGEAEVAVENGSKEATRVEVWVKCGQCGKESEARGLTDLARTYSWAKFLELLLYTDLLRPPTICSHTESTAYFLRTSKVLLSLVPQSVEVLETRLPKLQVGPNVPKRKPGQAAANAAVEGLMLRDERGKEAQIAKEEMRAWVRDLERRIQMLRARLESSNAAANARTKDAKEGDGPTESSKESKETADERSFSLQTLASDLDSAQATLIETFNQAPLGQLNDWRRQCTATLEGVQERLSGWMKGHGIDKDSSEVPVQSPDWAGGSCHALPGSSLLVREDEPSTLIAYTLSSLAYFTELAATSKAPVTVTDSTKSPDDAKISDESPRPPSTATAPAAAPDNDAWNVDVRRRDTPRDILSLRTVSKKRSEASIAGSGKMPMSLTPALKSASLELSLEQVEGTSTAGDRFGELVKTISKATAGDPDLRIERARSPSASESDMSSSVSKFKGAEGLGLAPGRVAPKFARRGTDDLAPPSSYRRSVSSSVVLPMTPGSTNSASNHSGKDTWGSSVTSSFTSSFNNILKLGTNVTDSLASRVRSSDRSLANLIGVSPLTGNTDNAMTSTPELPHIQFSYTLPGKLRLGCTVYYAASFDVLRRRCAIDKAMIRSLEKTKVWKAEGGKSKAMWWKTEDGRFIVKELVSKWNVSDTQALLDIAPAYFEYLASTHNKATALAKIVGFYTIKIHDLQTSTKKSMDLLVMENLFYTQDVSKTYDLKGIESRRVPKNKDSNGPNNGGGTLWDGEWIDAQAKSPTLLHPHARRTLLDSLSLDTKFLNSQGIMDYSLLLGLDLERKVLVTGLVDAVGSFGLWKRLESASKVGLKGKGREGEVTVIPPEQYRERFETALKTYFLACPDKWSRTTRRVGAGIGTQADELPSVL